MNVYISLLILVINFSIYANEFSVQPLYLEFTKSDNNKQVPFEIKIGTDQAMTLDLSIYEAEQTLSGRLSFIKSESQNMVSLKNNTIEFQRGGEKYIRGNIIFPYKKNETKLYAIMIEENKPLKKKGIELKVRYAVILKIDTLDKRVLEKINIEHIEIKNTPQGHMLTARINNVGQKSIEIKGTAILRDQYNKKIDEYELKSESSWIKKTEHSIIFPKSLVNVFNKLPLLKKGIYRVVFKFKLNDKRTITKKYEFTI